MRNSWKGKALKQLTFHLKKRSSAGRNSSGRITVFHRGGGSKRLQRKIDFKRSTSMVGIVERIEYDPNRSSWIALVRWIEGVLRRGKHPAIAAFSSLAKIVGTHRKNNGSSLARKYEKTLFEERERRYWTREDLRAVSQDVKGSIANNDAAKKPARTSLYFRFIMKHYKEALAAGEQLRQAPSTSEKRGSADLVLPFSWARKNNGLKAPRILGTREEHPFFYKHEERNPHGLFAAAKKGGRVGTSFTYILASEKLEGKKTVMNFIHINSKKPSHVSSNAFFSEKTREESNRSHADSSPWLHDASKASDNYQKAFEKMVGNCIPLAKIPIGTWVHNIERNPGQGAKLTRAAGTFAQIIKKVENTPQCIVRLPSGVDKLIDSRCRATIGIVSNHGQKRSKLSKKAGQSRWLGRRPIVRGVAMNPVDHPHGGGEGRTKGGRPSVSPWGKPTKGGFRTVVRKRISL
uniref:Large ribosomal subunit protein uL2m n=1 Tax=Pellia epiphylla TaxID=40340 RepID=A0A4Y5WSH6_9MARC|nr:ribosomal protein L2 [Pellia epiphylla]WIA66705.1 ribosomal protein L2 [Pellia epiphylla var. borealis]QDE10605.1 ribosomal protein L2 [Pellia epiphylla]WIA66664.1 ribosomal protein L2 [Pellia epiphylla]WIA66746.1 ribosomal protein L2 [Pellia epiphylla var. borealis]WIA66787.1 ribosomal protein L2 [Pellia epiphylla]